MKKEYYNASIHHDKTYDGRVFIGVKATGAYCRPLCPTLSKHVSVEYYNNSFLAEKNGYQPCLRCFPELAPGPILNFSEPALAVLAVKLIESHPNGWLKVKEIAALCGISITSLDEFLKKNFGFPTNNLLENSRLNFARKLIIETNLPLLDVMLACNFGATEYFSNAYKKRFRCYPHETERAPLSVNSVVLSVPYLKPYDFNGMMRSYRDHQIGNLEWFEEDKMFRLVSWEDQIGHFSVANDAPNSRLLLEINFLDVKYYKNIFNRVSTMFDVACDPHLLDDLFKKNNEIWELSKKYPGVRIPSGWDPFEISIATILGQLVSVERGRALVSDLIELLGEPTSFTWANKVVKKFPLPEVIAAADLSLLKTTGVRKKTLTEFSKAFLNKDVHFDANQHIEDFKQTMLKIYGIGPWTANYVALKAFKHTDAFPDSDLLLARAIKLFPKDIFGLMQPIRGYVAMLLWYEYAQPLSKNKSKKAKILADNTRITDF